MCFSPQVSVTIAIIEFILGFIILLKFRRSIITIFSAIFLFVLGLYQLTEFMLCISVDSLIWGSLGFVVYTFLPAIALHFVLRFIDSKLPKFVLYIPAIIFAAFPLFLTKFVTSGVCYAVFVSVKNVLFSSKIGRALYWLYYFGYLVIICYLCLKNYKTDTNPIMRKISIYLFLGILVATLPPIIFIVIFPTYEILFPSIYCDFALLFAAIAFVSAYLDNKYLSQIIKKKKL